MDCASQKWYLSCMANTPTFTLFGETTPFPDVVHCETFLARAPEHGWAISAHRHANMAQLFEITRGTVAAKVDGIDMVLSGGDFLYVPALSVHEFILEPRTDGKVISFPQSILRSIGPASSQLPTALGQAYSHTLTPQLTGLTQTLFHILGSAQVFRQQIAVGLAHSVLGMVASLAPTAQLSPASVRLSRFAALIADHQNSHWTAADYAAELCITTGHLSRLCRSATGVGASLYIEHAKMADACRMLAFTRMPIAEIGFRLGYEDPSYFSKRFRVVRAQTPSEYRQYFVS
jgi:AraC family transcriptional activator of pobA